MDMSAAHPPNNTLASAKKYSKCGERKACDCGVIRGGKCSIVFIFGRRLSSMIALHDSMENSMLMLQPRHRAFSAMSVMFVCTSTVRAAEQLSVPRRRHRKFTPNLCGYKIHFSLDSFFLVETWKANTINGVSKRCLRWPILRFSVLSWCAWCTLHWKSKGLLVTTPEIYWSDNKLGKLNSQSLLAGIKCEKVKHPSPNRATMKKIQKKPDSILFRRL